MGLPPRTTHPEGSCTNGETQHSNARLTPKCRRELVACVLEQSRTMEAAAQRFQVDAKTVWKWRVGSSPEATPAGRTALRVRTDPPIGRRDRVDDASSIYASTTAGARIMSRTSYRFIHP